MSKTPDFNDKELHDFDLSRRYGRDFSPPNGISWRQHILLFSIISMIMVFIGWASVARLDEVARGDGKVVPASEVQVVQSLEGGIIDSFEVKEGDTVDQGQVLLRMHNVEAVADYAAANQKYLSLLATVSRLQAEANNGDPVFPEELQQSAPELVREEQNSFNANQLALDTENNVLQEQRLQKEQELAELQRKISDVTSILDLARKERGMVAPMVKKGAASEMEVLQLDRQIAQQEADLNGLQLSLPRAEAAVREMEERESGSRQSFQAEAQKNLAEKTSDLNAAREALKAYEDRSARTDIRSPMHGIVKDVKIKTVGGVVQPGQTIMEIVPLEDRLVIEGRIKPADIAFVHPGQKATVRLSAFDFSIYGALYGEVTDLSADSITDDKGVTFYRVRVATDQNTLVKNGKSYPIIPGMQATIDILTGKKTVMGYILKPFIKGAQTALTER